MRCGGHRAGRRISTHRSTHHSGTRNPPPPPPLSFPFPSPFHSSSNPHLRVLSLACSLLLLPFTVFCITLPSPVPLFGCPLSFFLCVCMCVCVWLLPVLLYTPQAFPFCLPFFSFFLLSFFLGLFDTHTHAYL